MIVSVISELSLLSITPQGSTTLMSICQRHNVVYVDVFAGLPRVIADGGFRGIGDEGVRFSVVVGRDCGAGLKE